MSTPTITQLTPQGIIVSLLDDRIAQLAALYRGIFGDDINLDPNSIDGMTLGIYAESINNLDQLAEAVYNSFNPSTASGAALSRLVQLNGITRNVGAYSEVDVVCTGTTNTLIEAGSIVNSADGTSSWVTIEDAIIGDDGTATVTLRCTVLGPVQADANTLTDIGTVIYGWQTVSNPAAVPTISLGALQETDEALRLRRASSTATSAQGIIESLYGALANLSGVTQVRVYENPTDSSAVSADNPVGLAPHSINVVVLGGNPQDIFNTIWLKRSAGCTMLGAQVGIVTDSYGNQHRVKYDLPTQQNIYVIVNATARAQWPTNGVALVKAAIMGWVIANQTLGVDVVQSELYTPINTVPGISINSLLIGTSPTPTSTANIPIAYNAIATFDPSRIIVNIS